MTWKSPWPAWAVAAVLSAQGAVPAAAVQSATPAAAPGAPAPVDTAGLGAGPGSTMSMLYERTLLNIDVLRVSLRFGPDAAAAILAGLAVGPDSAALAAIDARRAVVRCVFERDVTLDQFLDGLARDLTAARESGAIGQVAFDRIMADVSVQYQPIAERGFRDGDAMWYGIAGDTLDVVLVSADGEELIRERAVGPERRRGTLAGFLAPRTHLREGLLKSLDTGSV